MSVESIEGKIMWLAAAVGYFEHGQRDSFGEKPLSLSHNEMENSINEFVGNL